MAAFMKMIGIVGCRFPSSAVVGLTEARNRSMQVARGAFSVNV